MVAAATEKKVNYVPLNDYVLIKELPREDGLIVIPETADVGPGLGKVVAVGPGKWEFGSRTPMDLKVGDVVSMMSDYSFTQVPLGGVDYMMIKASWLKVKVEG